MKHYGFGYCEDCGNGEKLYAYGIYLFCYVCFDKVVRLGAATIGN